MFTNFPKRDEFSFRCDFVFIFVFALPNASITGFDRVIRSSSGVLENEAIVGKFLVRSNAPGGGAPILPMYPNMSFVAHVLPEPDSPQITMNCEVWAVRRTPRIVISAVVFQPG